MASMSGTIGTRRDLRNSDLSWASDAKWRLLLERQELLRKINSEPHSSEAPKAGEQRDDFPAEDEIREVEFSHLEMHHRRLLEITEALERISSGNFGYCLQCNAMISEARLQADPAVSRCYVCQTIAEQGFKGPRLRLLAWGNPARN